MVEFFDFKETEGFVSKKTVIDERLDGMNNTNEQQSEEIAENKRVNDEQDQAIAENKELDEKQAQDIESNKELIDANDEADKVRDEKIASIKLEKVDELTYEFTNAEGDVTTINIPKDMFLKDASYDAEKKEITLVVVTADGDKTLTIDMSDLVDVYVIADDSTEYMTINADNEISIKKVIETLDELNNAATENATAIENEVTRAQSAESELSEAIESEVSRALDAESGLTEALETAKSELADAIKSEETRALEAESGLSEALENEVTRAQDVENVLSEVLENAKSELSDAIKAEETRAQEAESALTNTIESVKTELSDAVKAEETRAEGVESEIKKSIEHEASLRELNDSTLDNKFTSLDAQHKSDLLNLTNDFNDEVARAMAAEKKNEDAIALLNDDATVEGSVKFTVNASIAKVIDDAPEAFDTLKEIADWISDHSSTAIEMQNQINSNTNAIETEVVRAQEAESGLTEAINSEVTRAQETESEISEALESAKSELSDAVKAEETRALEVESGLSEAINSEVTRAQDVETTLSEALESAKTELSSAIEGVESALTDAMAEVAETYQVKGDYATKAEVEAEGSRALEAESGLTDSINAEKERALSAESELSDSINEVESALTDAMEEVAETYQVKGDYASVASVEAMVLQISQLMTRVEMLESLQTNLVVASDASAVASIAPELAASTALVLNSKDAIEAMTANTTFESIAIIGGTNDKTIRLMATDKVIVDSLEVKGDAGNINGKINYTTPNLEVKNLTVDNESSAYNLFEGSQKPTDESTLNKVVTVTNANINAPSLTHNVINVYTPANDAVITIADSYFNVNAEKTNIVRISNTSNATGVSIVFDNVVLSYEDGGADRGYAGLMFYQAYGADKSYSGDTSAIATWSLKFKDCYYVTDDGSKEKITALNYGQDNQVTYAYGINKGGKTDLSEIISDITFE